MVDMVKSTNFGLIVYWQLIPQHGRKWLGGATKPRFYGISLGFGGPRSGSPS